MKLRPRHLDLRRLIPRRRGDGGGKIQVKGMALYWGILRGFAMLLLLLCAAVVPAASSANGEEQQLRPGVILSKVVAAQNAEQSYALYLPSNYSAAKRWPVVYAFEPGARGHVPVELMKEAAEKYGYIIAGSNNSRNGSWKIEAEAARAMYDDTHARLSIDDKRLYFAGFSGGSRVAATVAQRCKCAAGVIVAGAGFQPDAQSNRDSFAVFASVGTYDFNYGEVIALDEALQKMNAQHFLRRFEGPHQWPSAAVLGEALTWMQLQAMKSNREPRDEAFISAQLALETQRAKAFESTDPFAAWFEYRQAAETFDGLADVTALRAEEKSLQGQKAVTESAKREKQEIKEQGEITADIFSAMATLNTPDPSDTAPAAATRNALREQILTLKNRADHEKRPEKARALKRALEGVFVNLMEEGLGRMDAKDARHALSDFEVALAAYPDSSWAWSMTAEARAADGDKKGALESLRHVKEKWSDKQAFTDWLNSDAAFAKIRDTAEFRALLQ
ncbi:MAG TPA: hypothetical protein VGH83_05920 [Candidatus Acidoferrum sp.]|jgi:dienelactone hydrolase